MEIIGFLLTGFEIVQGAFGPVLTLRYYENPEAQRRSEETVISFAVPPSAALEMAKQMTDAVELGRMPPAITGSVN